MKSFIIKIQLVLIVCITCIPGIVFCQINSTQINEQFKLRKKHQYFDSPVEASFGNVKEIIFSSVHYSSESKKGTHMFFNKHGFREKATWYFYSGFKKNEYSREIFWNFDSLKNELIETNKYPTYNNSRRTVVWTYKLNEQKDILSKTKDEHIVHLLYLRADFNSNKMDSIKNSISTVIFEYVYDSLGNLVCVADLNNKDTLSMVEYKYPNSNDLHSAIYKTKKKYKKYVSFQVFFDMNKKEELTIKRVVAENEVSQFFYDYQGRDKKWIKTNSLNGETGIWRLEYEDDKKGNWVKKEIFYKNGKEPEKLLTVENRKIIYW